MASLGDEVAEVLARKLGWELITRNQLINRFFTQITDTRDQHLLTESAKFYLTQTKDNGTYLDFLMKALRDLARQQSAVLVGFGSQVIFADDPDTLHIRITAPEKVRISRVKRKFHVSDGEAEQILQTADKKHKRFVSTVFGSDLTDPGLYHLAINTASLTVDECVAAVMALQKEHALKRKIARETEKSEVIDHQTEHTVFKNPAETEFAKILDMYQIEYKYEPKTFPIEWDAEGNITMAFSPDFYLTKFDTYIELTIMNQKYVSEKKKKLKKVRELYPGTNINIVYKRDFHSLIERFSSFMGEPAPGPTAKPE
jgi:cytidylate kinase